MRLDKAGVRTPVRRNGVATRAKIIAAATKLMAQQHHPMTIRGLAAEAGVSPAAIYQFFASLQDVGRAVEEESIAALSAAMADVVTTAQAREHPVHFFHALLTGVVQHQAAHPEALCMAHRGESHEPRAALAAALRRTLANQVEHAFAAARPDVTPDRLRQVLAVAQSAMLGALQDLPGRDQHGRQEHLDEVGRLAGTYVDAALGPTSAGQAVR